MAKESLLSSCPLDLSRYHVLMCKAFDLPHLDVVQCAPNNVHADGWFAFDSVISGNEIRKIIN